MKERLIRRTAIIVAIVWSALMLAAAATASGERSAQRAAASPIVVGNVTSIAGFGGTFTAFDTSLKAYISMVNKNGGINGRPIKLIIEDDAGDAAKNAAAARKLVTQDHVIALVGNGNLVDGASQPYLQSKGIPIIGDWCSSGPKVCETPNLFPIIFQPLDPNKCSGWVADLAKAEGATKLAFFNLDLAPSITVRACQEARAKAIGLTEVTSPQVVSLSAADATAQVKAAMDAGALDFLIVTDSGTVGKIIKSAQQLGFKGRIFALDLQQNIAISALDSATAKAFSGRLFSGSYALLPSDTANAQVRQFRARVSKVYWGNPYALPGWAAGATLVDALRAVGPDSSKLLKYMQGLKDYTAHGLIGPISYAAGSVGPTRCVVRYVWNGQAFTRAKSQGPGFTCTKYVKAS